ncbi:hypothetical protein [Streptomyces sp. NPDC008150]|uniref:hypothetical protein n=1 Tax=Streptomyces sp. NPDC008150 TaxID=3364816 RepID=UPI0036E25538
MPTSSSASTTIPPTVWLARGHHAGPEAADEVVRTTLRRLDADGTVHSFLELPAADTPGHRVFEARWEVADTETVTVRARLVLTDRLAAEEAQRDPRHAAPHPGWDWVLAAEAERSWDPRWPSPAAFFWPADTQADWDHEPVTGLRYGALNDLPGEDKELRRVLRNARRDGWGVHVVVHEAMTPDARGRRPLAPMLPPSLRHRVVEHRAAPQQFRSVNWALREFGVQVPRGGAVVLPGTPAPPGYAESDFSVRSVFLDGSEPVELIGSVTAFVSLSKPLPDGAAEVLTALREDWHLVTMEEELNRQRELVAMYSQALEAMTASRDLYREAAERAHEALAVYREGGGDAADRPRPEHERPARPALPPASPRQSFARTFERLRDTAKSLRPGPVDDSTGAAGAADGPVDDPAATRPPEGTPGTSGTPER